jgi:hypothetical protein
VAEVVQAHVREPDAPGDFGERVRERIGVHGSAVAAVDDEVEVLPLWTAEESALVLLLPMSSERGDGIAGRWIVRRAVAVFPCRTETVPVSRSTSRHVSVTTSPRRIPVVAATRIGARTVWRRRH